MQGTVWEFDLRYKQSDFNKLNKNFDTMDRKVAGVEGNTSRIFDTMGKKANKFGSNFKKNLAGISNELPGVGHGLALLSNPLTIVAGVAIGAVAAIKKASKEQAIFNNEFLELQNLNLDKTDKEIDDLRSRVLGISFDKALNPQKTSKAFFDVQSATGKYGYEVEQTVGKIGVFARTMKADFNTAVEGGAKAMGIFGFSSNQLDDYLASSFKTVQVGVTTFDQLSKVQVEYLNSAKSAGQGFDEANKLFSVFSKNAKSVDIAANLTKTAFEDLGKQSTQKGLKNIGVNLFDATGKMKGLDAIASEIVPKLSNMNDADFSKLKEEIGGSEGIRGLLDQLKNSGENVLDTFKAFDNTEFDFDTALKNANGDLTIMSEIVDNKLTASWIRFGEAITPMLLKMKTLASSLLNVVSGVANSISYLSNTNEGYRKQKQEQNQAVYSSFNNELSKSFKSNDDINNFLNSPKSDQEKLINSLKNSFSDKKKTASNTLSEINGQWFPNKKIQNHFTARNKSYQSLTEMLTAVEKGGSIEDLFKQVGFNIQGSGGAPNTNTTGLGVPTQTDEGGTGSSNKGGLAGIYAAADKVRNVTVNIQNLVEKFTVHTENGEGLSSDEILHKIEEVLIRAVNDAELTLSNN